MSYKPKVHYTRFQLVRGVMHDQITDIRCSGPGAYQDECRKAVSVLFKNRHTTKLDDFGWPVCLKGGAK